MTKNIGFLLLAIYLILVGLVGLFGFNLGSLSIILPLLALISGIAILLKR